MAAASLGINITIRGQDFASGALKSAGKNVQGLQRRTANFGAAAGRIFAGVTAAIATMKGVMSLTEESRAFEFEMAKIAGLTGKSVDQLGALGAAAEKASIESTFSPTESLMGMKNLITMGFNTKQAVDALTPSLALAEAAGIDVGTATEGVASALRVFGISANKAGDTAGRLFALSSKSAVASNELKIALANVSGGANSAQQGIDAALVSIGLLKNTGVEASVAGSQVGIAMSNIAKNSKHFKTLGVGLTGANGKLKQFPELVLDVSKALDKKFTDPIKRAQTVSKLFGERGKKAFIGIEKQLKTGVESASGELLKGQDAIDDFYGALAGGEKQLKGAANAVRNTLKGQIDLLGGSVGLAMKKIGDEMVVVIKPVVRLIIDNLNALIDWFTKLPQSTKSAIGKFVLSAGVMMAVAGVAIALKGAIGLLGIALGKVALVLAPLVLVGAAFVGFLNSSSTSVGAFKVALADFGSGVANVFSVLWSNIKAFVGGVKAGFMAIMDEAGPVFDDLAVAMQPLSDAMNSLSGDTSGAASAGATFGKILAKVALVGVKVLTQILNTINGIRAGASAMGGVFDPVAESLSEVGVEISTLLTQLGIMKSDAGGTASAFGLIGAVIGGAFAMAARAVATTVTFIGGLLKSLVMIFSGIVDVIAGTLSGDWARVWNGLGKIVVGIAKGIVSTVQFMVQGIAQAIDAAGKIAGKNFGAEAKIKSFSKGIQGKLDSLVLEPAAVTTVTAKPDTTKIDQLIANTKTAAPPVPPPQAVPGIAAAKAQPTSIDPASIAAIGAAARKAPAPITKATLTVDGAKIGEIVANHSVGAANDGSVPVEVQ